MEALLAAALGGLLALGSVYVGSRRAWHNELQRRSEDRHLDLTSSALAALQRLVRATIDIAYVDLPPRAASHEDTPQQAEIRARYEDAITEWNVAMYAVLVGADPDVATSVRQLDEEVDRLMDEALGRVWSRQEFRTERQYLGRAMAAHADLARVKANLPPLALTSIWTWDAG